MSLAARCRVRVAVLLCVSDDRRPKLSGLVYNHRWQTGLDVRDTATLIAFAILRRCTRRDCASDNQREFRGGLDALQGERIEGRH